MEHMKGCQYERQTAQSTPRFRWLDTGSWFALSDDPDILVAQYANLKQQVPLLYLLLILIASAGFYLLVGTAPFLPLAAMSALFIAVCSVRLVFWMWFLPSAEEIGVDQVRVILRRTTFAVIPICLSYLGYGFMLDQFGGPYEQAGVAVCLVLTASCCIFCLMHLPQAALLVNLLTMLPYAMYHVYKGNQTFLVVALIAGLVTTLMIRVSRNAFGSFIELITSRAELAVQRGKAERLAAENASLAMTDSLTGLPNRRLLLARLEERVHSSVKSGHRFVVGVLDLDRFKPVNDVYGHAIGDQLLVAVGQRLKSITHERLLIARVGGDEFGLLIDDSVTAAHAIGDRIITLLHQPFEIEGHSLSLGCSIGFAAFPDAGRTASSLFDRADYALYDVKADHRGKHAFFTPDLEKRLRAETELESALLSSDLETELQVALQPILCLRSAKVCGIEALGRWNSPLIGQVEPARFIEAAERLNMMGRITTTLFAKALAAAGGIPDEIELSFNLSTHDIVNPATIDLLVAAIVERNIAPERVTFEITETALMQDYDKANAQIERLRRMGVSIALDDFGTGFSSLSYLSRLPIDKIKIDRSFVRGLSQPAVKKIVAAILGMCETLELECIVEGVETLDECEILMGLGCALAQGYVFARPMDIADLRAWLELDGIVKIGPPASPGLNNHPAFIDLHHRYG